MRADGQAAQQLSDPQLHAGVVYDAFISYDHDDRAVAQGIQRGLHRIGKRIGQLRAGAVAVRGGGRRGHMG